MNREELIKQKNKIQAELDRLTELINKSAERWKPEYGSYYYYLDSHGTVQRTYWNNGVSDNHRYNIGNCFKTEQEVYDYKENLITKQQLKDLALELNKGEEINWHNDTQGKYGIVYSTKNSKLELTTNGMWQEIGHIYTLDYDFLKIAKERIGEEKLIKLIKSGV